MSQLHDENVAQGTRQDGNGVLQCAPDVLRDMLLNQRRHYLGLARSIEQALGIEPENDKLRRENAQLRQELARLRRTTTETS